MKQQDFERENNALWLALESWLAQVPNSTLPTRDVPKAYRQVCHHLALTRARNYSAGLEDRLNRLALAGHRALYASSARGVSNLWQFFARDFPRSVRKNWVSVVLMAVLLYGPIGGLMLAIHISPPLAYSVLSPSQASSIESMYDPANRQVGGPDSQNNFFMFGFYIFNNIGIGFRTFAAGVIAGIGTIYVVVTNGIHIGTVFGHLSVNGYGSTLWPFVAGHGAFELNAIVLAGAAGLKLGWSFFAPGRRTRRDALRHAAYAAMPMVYGFTTMLLLAAFIEAFWSSTSWPPAMLKYVVGATLWVLVLAYFAVAGRSRGS